MFRQWRQRWVSPPLICGQRDTIAVYRPIWEGWPIEKTAPYFPYTLLVDCHPSTLGPIFNVERNIMLFQKRKTVILTVTQFFHIRGHRYKREDLVLPYFGETSRCQSARQWKCRPFVWIHLRANWNTLHTSAEWCQAGNVVWMERKKWESKDIFDGERMKKR